MKRLPCIITLTLVVLIALASVSSASLQLNSLFGFPINLNQIVAPFANYDNGSINMFILNGSTQDTALTTQPSPTPTPTPIPTQNPVHSTEPVASPTALQNSASNNNGSIIIPPITQAQKEEAFQIASTSPLCSEYNTYPDDTWTCEWAPPADGHTILVWKAISNGSIEITVDLNTHSVVTSYLIPPIGEVVNSRMY
jgi:hypothetical protein